MIETIASFIETLFEHPEGSWRSWGAILFGTIGSILAYFAAREWSRKWHKLKGDHRAALENGPISAVAITTEAHGEVPYTATISASGPGYRLLVEKGPNPDSIVVLDQTAGSLDEMERLLREKTQFILSDFS